MRRALLCGLAVLTAVPAAHAAGPRYRFVAESTLTVVASSTCSARDGAYETTETFTWRLESRQAGSSEVGRPGRPPRGSTLLTGTIRRETARETQGFPPSEPQGSTEPMQESRRERGVLHRLAGGTLELRLSHLGLLDPRFAPLDRGESITIRQQPAPETSTTQQATTDSGQCTDQERREVSRRIVVTRVR